MNEQAINNREKDKIKIIQLNANSIYSKSKRHQLQILLKKHNPDVVIIAETKLNNNNTVNINGYKIYRNDRTTDNGGGTAIFTKQNMDSELIKTPTNIKSIEICTILIKLENNKKMYISSIYKPPKNKIITSELTEIIQINKNAAHIIAGDFNAHHTEWNEKFACRDGKNIYEWYEQNKNIYNIDIYASEKPTCFRSVPGTYVDFGIYSTEIKIINTLNNKKIKSERFTDHAAMIFEIECTPQKTKLNVLKDFNKTNWTDLKNFINERIKTVEIPINKNLNPNEIDAYTTIINNIYNTAIEKYVPELKIPDDLIILSKKSQELLKKKQNLTFRVNVRKERNKFTYNYNIICRELKETKQNLHNSIKNDYSTHYEKKMKNMKMDNNIFKNIKQISTYKTKNQIPNILYNEQTNETYTSEEDKANALADQFEKIHKITNRNISIMESIINITYDLYNNEPTLSFNEQVTANFKDDPRYEEIKERNIEVQNTHEFYTSVDELQMIIKTRNTKKSTGPDNTSNYMLKKMPLNFLKKLVIIINHIINTQHIPAIWKIGRITPILKANKNKQNIDSYRPINAMSAIWKCIEKKLDIRIRKQLETNNILTDSQFGFRPKRSTEMAVSKFISDVAEGLNNKKSTIAVLIDLQAAFDTLWHKALIYKLHKMTIDKNLICLIKNYLTNRKFYVQIGNKKSNIKDIAAGAPQGGILSATLFIIYINDFPKYKNTNIKELFFADDTIIYNTTNDIKKAQNEMNEYLCTISNYIKKWKLKINENKCEQISIVGEQKDLSRANRKNALNIKLKINDKTIRKCDNVKYLGVTISKNFKFNEHVEKTIKKANISKSELHNIFTNKLINCNIKTLAYKQLIRPIFLYASALSMLALN